MHTLSFVQVPTEEGIAPPGTFTMDRPAHGHMFSNVAEVYEASSA